MKNFKLLRLGGIYRDSDGDIVRITVAEHAPRDWTRYTGEFLNESSRVDIGDTAQFYGDGRTFFNHGVHGDSNADLMEKLA